MRCGAGVGCRGPCFRPTIRPVAIFTRWKWLDDSARGPGVEAPHLPAGARNAGCRDARVAADHCTGPGRRISARHRETEFTLNVDAGCRQSNCRSLLHLGNSCRRWRNCGETGTWVASSGLHMRPFRMHTKDRSWSGRERGQLAGCCAREAQHPRGEAGGPDGQIRRPVTAAQASLPTKATSASGYLNLRLQGTYEFRYRHGAGRNRTRVCRPCHPRIIHGSSARTAPRPKQAVAVRSAKTSRPPKGRQPGRSGRRS